MVAIKDFETTVQVADERLVVLIPDQLDNVANFARQVYWMAAGQQRDVIYAAIVRHEDSDLEKSRLLTTLEAVTQSESLRAHAVQVDAEGWADALRQVAHPGDIVICPDAQTLANANGKSVELGRSLEQALGVRVQYLPEVYAMEKPAPAPWVRSLLSWVTGLVILVGFSFLEFRLAGVISGSLKKVVLLLLIALEFGILYLWDRVFA